MELRKEKKTWPSRPLRVRYKQAIPFRTLERPKGCYDHLQSANINSVACVHTQRWHCRRHTHTCMSTKKDLLSASVSSCRHVVCLEFQASHGVARIKCQYMHMCVYIVYVYVYVYKCGCKIFMSKVISILLFLLLLTAAELNRQI